MIKWNTKACEIVQPWWVGGALASDNATIKNNNVIVHGRIDDVINIRGHRIGSEEVESTVLKLKEVFECSAISVEDELEGSTLNIFIATKNNKKL